MKSNIKNEIWKDIQGFEGIYQVSNYGNVRSLDRRVHNYLKKGRILKQFSNQNGYKYLSLSSKDKKSKHAYVHILVANAFIENENGYTQVNHKDFDKSNNNVDNLEWVSPQQNILHFRKSKYLKKCEENKEKKFQNKCFEKIEKYKKPILEKYAQGYSAKIIAKDLSVGKDFVLSVLKIFDKL